MPCILIGFHKVGGNGSLRKNLTGYSNIRNLFNSALGQTGDCISVRDINMDVIPLNSCMYALKMLENR